MIKSKQFKNKKLIVVLLISLLIFIILASLLLFFASKNHSSKVKNQNFAKEKGEEENRSDDESNVSNNEITGNDATDDSSQHDEEDFDLLDDDNDSFDTKSDPNYKEKEDSLKKESSEEKEKPSQHKHLDLSNFTDKDLLEHCEKSLLSIINRLEKEKNSLQKSKKNIFNQGLYLFKQRLATGRSDFHQLLRSNIDDAYSFKSNPNKNKQACIVKFSRWWMNYNRKGKKDEFIVFVDFANRYLGGDCWGEKGNAQEEMMVQSFPAFALLLSEYNPYWWRNVPNSKYNPKLFTRKPEGIDKGLAPSLASPNSAHSLLLTDFRPFFEISYDKQKNINHIKKTINNPPAVNILAMAAPQLTKNQQNNFYTENIVRDILSQALAGFDVVKKTGFKKNKKVILHTGRWGTGVFAHDLNMMTAVQLAAAQLIFDKNDEIIFTAINANEEAELKSLADWINNLFKTSNGSAKISPQKIVDSLLDKGKKENWKTK